MAPHHWRVGRKVCALKLDRHRRSTYPLKPGPCKCVRCKWNGLMKVVGV